MARTIWVTGGSAGIGEAVVKRLAANGDRIIASARGQDKLTALAATHPNIETLTLDITDHHAVQAGVEQIEIEHGPIDLAIFNAGTHAPVDAQDFKADGLRRILEINLLGTANCLEALMPRMIARGCGHIAVVASVAGYRGLPTAAYYGASKGGTINMVEALRFDLQKAGVKLQLINPGFVETPLTDKNEFDMPFLITAEKAADYIMRGLVSSRFEIAFPRRFAFIMKVLRILPYALYFPLVGRGTRK